MAAGAPRLANEMTFTFGTTFANLEITDFDWSGIEKASVQVNHFGKTGGMINLFSPAYDPGTLDITCLMRDDEATLFTADLLATNVGTTGEPLAPLTMTFPNNDVTAGKWVADNACLVGIGFSGTVDDKLMMTLSFKLSEDIVPTDVAAV